MPAPPPAAQQTAPPAAAAPPAALQSRARPTRCRFPALPAQMPVQRDGQDMARGHSTNEGCIAARSQAGVGWRQRCPALLGGAGTATAPLPAAPSGLHRDWQGQSRQRPQGTAHPCRLAAAAPGLSRPVLSKYSSTRSRNLKGLERKSRQGFPPCFALLGSTRHSETCGGAQGRCMHLLGTQKTAAT